MKRRDAAAPDPAPAKGSDQENRAMPGQDPELEHLRSSVSCAAVLELTTPPWRLDHKNSTHRALKYRRGAGEVLIVNHEGRGWWDPQSNAKGDLFTLVQFLTPGANFGQVRQALRRLVGVVRPTQSPLNEERQTRADRPLPERWQVRRRLRQGSATWHYLATVRALPKAVLAAAETADIVREGHKGSAWFAHRDLDGDITHIEIRGPDVKISLRGGSKTLFRLASAACNPRRLALTEGPIDALSLAALEGLRGDTIYAAMGGGMGPGTEHSIQQLLLRLVAHPGAVLIGASDANAAGERFAGRHAGLAAAAGVAFVRLRPPEGSDWNDMVVQGRGL